MIADVWVRFAHAWAIARSAVTFIGYKCGPDDLRGLADLQTLQTAGSRGYELNWGLDAVAVFPGRLLSVVMRVATFWGPHSLQELVAMRMRW